MDVAKINTGKKEEQQIVASLCCTAVHTISIINSGGEKKNQAPDQFPELYVNNISSTTAYICTYWQVCCVFSDLYTASTDLEHGP